MRKYLLLMLSVFTLTAQAETISLWPTIPFMRGADLCQFQDAYGQSRNSALNGYVNMAERLMRYGAGGSEALDMIVRMDQLVDKNRALAVQGRGLDVTLESTLKAYLDRFYQDARPRKKKIIFTQATTLQNSYKKLTAMTYGTYSYAPNCRGEILVTLHLIMQNGETINFEAQGRPNVVMSAIASRMIEKFQRTQFPSKVRIGNRTLELVGAPGAPVDFAPSPEIAEDACRMMDARLPTRNEYEYLSLLGDWNGGVGLNDKVWALADGYILAPLLRNPTPVRRPRDVNEREFLYYCVQ